MTRCKLKDQLTDAAHEQMTHRINPYGSPGQRAFFNRGQAHPQYNDSGRTRLLIAPHTSNPLRSRRHHAHVLSTRGLGEGAMPVLPETKEAVAVSAPSPHHRAEPSHKPPGAAEAAAAGAADALLPQFGGQPAWAPKGGGVSFRPLTGSSLGWSEASSFALSGISSARSGSDWQQQQPLSARGRPLPGGGSGRWTPLRGTPLEDWGAYYDSGAQSARLSSAGASSLASSRQDWRQPRF